MTSHFDLVAAALVAKLGAQANLATDVAGRMYDTETTERFAGDYLLFQHVAGGETNDCPNEGLEMTYLVKYVSTIQARARTGVGHVHTALHNQSLSITGWNCWRLEVGDLVSLPSEQFGKDKLYAFAVQIKIAIDKA